MKLPNKKYEIIYADPPWLYNNGGTQKSRGMAKSAYSCMPLEDIKNLNVKDISAENSSLFMWVTMPFLKMGFEVIEAWGFNYITCAFTWVKQNPSGNGIYSGLGHWTNGNAELCLFAKKGKPKRYSKSVKQIVLAPRGKHSEKPIEVRKRIVELMGDLPRIELFARNTETGWDSWGNEI